jgi:arylsulfatase A-like enzyme
MKRMSESRLVKALVMVLLAAACCCHDSERATPLQKLVSFPELQSPCHGSGFTGAGDHTVRMVGINGVHREGVVLAPGDSLQAKHKGGGALYFWVGVPSSSGLGKDVPASVSVTAAGRNAPSVKRVTPVAGKWTAVKVPLPSASVTVAIRLETEGGPSRAAGEAVVIGSPWIAPSPRPNIIVISIDTLRADHLEAYGSKWPTSPHISELAQESAVFEHCYSHASWTPPSVASLFTSLYPSQHGSLGKDRILLPKANLTMAETFAKAGYFTAAFSSSPFVHPDFGFAQGFRVFGFEENENAARLTEMVEQWLAERPDGPFFLYVMYFDPHFPYVPPKKYRHRFRKGPDGRPLWKEEHVPVIKSLFGLSAEIGRESYHHLHGSYRGEIAFTDDMLGMLVSRLRKAGLLENSILVLTSDHGEEFLEHGGFGHGNTLYEEQLHVPLLIRLPGGLHGKRRVNSIVRQADIFPTLLDFADMEHPRPLEGKSFYAALLGNKPISARPAYATSMHLLDEKRKMTSLRQSRHKLILYENPGDELLFDLDKDPAELRNLAREKPEKLESMIEALRTFEKNMAPPVVEKSGAASPERTRKMLESLGYVGE